MSTTTKESTVGRRSDRGTGHTVAQPPPPTAKKATFSPRDRACALLESALAERNEMLARYEKLVMTSSGLPPEPLPPMNSNLRAVIAGYNEPRRSGFTPDPPQRAEANRIARVLHAGVLTEPVCEALEKLSYGERVTLLDERLLQPITESYSRVYAFFTKRIEEALSPPLPPKATMLQRVDGLSLELEEVRQHFLTLITPAIEPLVLAMSLGQQTGARFTNLQTQARHLCHSFAKPLQAVWSDLKNIVRRAVRDEKPFTFKGCEAYAYKNLLQKPCDAVNALTEVAPPPSGPKAEPLSVTVPQLEELMKRYDDRAGPAAVHAVISRATRHYRDRTITGVSLGQLTQALDVMVDNAIDATRDLQGTGKRKAPLVEVRLDISASGIVLSVKDKGTGMKRSVIERIHEPDFTTKGLQGSGRGTSATFADLASRGADVLVRSASVEEDTKMHQYFLSFRKPDGAEDVTRELSEGRKLGGPMPRSWTLCRVELPFEVATAA